MRKVYASVALVALAIAFGCSDDGGGGSSATSTGGQTSTGGSATSGAAGSAAMGGSAGSAGNAGGGSGAISGSGGSAGQGGTAGNAGQGGFGDEGGAGDPGGAGGAGECAPSSSDDDCARCMLENCCEAWRECEADTNCNACGSCIDQLSDFGACILMQPPLCNYVGDDATARMIQCGCAPDNNSQCVGPCASACGFD